jgi:hypothetical protein
MAHQEGIANALTVSNRADMVQLPPLVFFIANVRTLKSWVAASEAASRAYKGVKFEIKQNGKGPLVKFTGLHITNAKLTLFGRDETLKPTDM